MASGNGQAGTTRRSIFITGGASGIGRATALLFAERGWFVGIADIDQQGLEDTLGLIGGGFNYAHRLDVRDRAQWDDALSAFATAAGGRIDVVFNNAGVGSGGELANLGTDEIEKCLDINLKGVLFGAQAAYPYLKASGPGSALINTASAAGITGGAMMSVYCATKFGVRGVTESLDGEWAADGITVASICPGFIDTPLLDQTGSRASNEKIRDRVTQAGLEITPVSEVAEAVWKAVHSHTLHHYIGPTAKKLNLVKRWFPGKLRARSRNNMQPAK